MIQLRVQYEDHSNATKRRDLRNSDLLRGKLSSRFRERDSQKTILHRGLDLIILKHVSIRISKNPHEETQ